MYEGPIVADYEISHRDLAATKTSRAGLGATLLGLLILGIGLPLLVLRMLGWALIRDVKRAVFVAGSMGQAAIEAAREK